MKQIELLIFGLIFLSIGCGSDQQKVQSSSTAREKESLSDSTYIKNGNAIAKASFIALSKRLKSVLDTGGVRSAVPYCQIKALPITDSVAQAHDVKIQRVAKRYRNPYNQLRGIDTLIYADYLNGLKTQPSLIKEGNKPVYYNAINMKSLCLKCHGDIDKNIGEDNYALIQKRYPQDKAIGFAEGDLRGLWKVTFN